MTTNDWLTIAAILLAPLLAIQASEYLHRRRERRQYRLDVFRRLMATRAAPLSSTHVEALNMIDIEYHGERRITDGWKAYLDHLNDQSLTPEAWAAKTSDLLADLLYQMACSMNYDFDRTHIKRAAYFPRGYGEAEADNLTIRKSLVDILSKGKPLPIEIAPSSVPERAKEGEEVARLMRGHLSGEVPLRIAIVKDDTHQTS